MALPKHVVSRIPQTPVPRGRLLDIAAPIDLDPATNGNRTVPLRWINGITWQPEPCYALRAMDVDACARIDFNGPPHACDAALTQTPFAVWDAFRGASLEFTPAEIEELLAGRFTLKMSAAFASELLTAAASGDRALRKSATVPTVAPGAAQPIYNALAIIEAELAIRLQGARGMVHVPPSLLGEAISKAAICLDPTTGQWETVTGHQVVADAGYEGAPQPTGFGAAATSGQAWIYASGPVRYAATAPAMVDDGNVGSTITNFTSLESAPTFTTHDDILRYRDAAGIFQFDDCPVTAVLASYSVNA